MNSLAGKLNLIARLINKGLGTRLYYAAIDGFDTHSQQAEIALPTDGRSVECHRHLLHGARPE